MTEEEKRIDEIENNLIIDVTIKIVHLINKEKTDGLTNQEKSLQTQFINEYEDLMNELNQLKCVEERPSPSEVIKIMREENLTPTQFIEKYIKR
jgi:hypothetical protein